MKKALCAKLFCAALGVAVAFKTKEKKTFTSCGTTSHQLQAGGLLRNYSLLVPGALCSNVSSDTIRHAPLVIAFGCFGCPAPRPETVQAFAAAGMVVAMPEGVGQSWNAEVCCGQALSQGIDDVGFVRALLDLLLDSSEIAPGLRLKRETVYAFGHSNGGFMSSHILKSLPAYFRGAVPVSGHIYNLGGMSTPKTMSIHFGKMDTAVNYKGCCASSRCCCGIDQAQGQLCQSVDDIFSAWLKINSCSGVSNSSSGLDMDCRQGIGCERPTQVCARTDGNHWTSDEQDGAHIAEFLVKDICSIQGHWQTGACKCKGAAQGPLCLD
eukprot:TRINITY_DN30739_c0_g1_i1.p1 TRINITY_DN30739_c0_g1~~TRINITY_DN30739_c0_g1_i1.p1  ORF type:complete len:324 (+),score=38.63 TRINITY_DN30739_c0_g1_i1:74-1045(+)